MKPEDLVGKVLRVIEITYSGHILCEDITDGIAGEGSLLLLKVYADDNYGPYFHPRKLEEVE